jgi:hypothetical protein
VTVNGVLAEGEALRDLSVSEARGDEPKDLLLAGCQRRPATGRTLAKLPQERGRPLRGMGRTETVEQVERPLRLLDRRVESSRFTMHGRQREASFRRLEDQTALLVQIDGVLQGGSRGV